MPKELKQRGRRAAKQQRDARENDDHPKKRRKIEGQADGSFTVSGNAGDDFISFGEADGDGETQTTTTFYGFLTEEEQEYYANVNNKISSDDFDDDEDRSNFIEAVHRETGGKEIKIASSQSCSRYLEKIIRLSNPKQLRGIFLAFLQDLDYLVQHRFGSHCVETLFLEAAKYVSTDSQSTEEGSTSFEALFLEATEKLQANAGYLLTERFASHTVRVLLLVLSGQPLEDESAKEVAASRKKEKTEPKSNTQPISQKERKVPKSFKTAWRSFVKTAVAGLDTTYLRALATSPTGNPVLQLLLRLELIDQDAKDATVLPKLIHDQNFEPESESSKFISSLIYDATGAFLVQALVKHLPGKQFKKMYKNLFRDRIGKLAKNEISSYVAISIFERVGKDDLSHALEAVQSELPGLVERNRLAVLRTLLERCSVRGVDLKPVHQQILDVYGGEPADTLSKMLKTASASKSADAKTEKPNGDSTAQKVPGTDLQGSLFAQSLLRIEALCDIVQQGLLTMDDAQLVQLSQNPAGSRVVQVSLTAETASLKFLRLLIPKFYGVIADLAVDASGSHVVDALWAGTKGSHFIKEKIAGILHSNETKLRDSMYGRTVWRNWSMDLYHRRHQEWQALARGIETTEQQDNGGKPQKKSAIELARDRYVQQRSKASQHHAAPAVKAS